MKTTLSLSPAAQIETECLVAVVLDRGEKDKTEPYVAAPDKPVQAAPADLLSGGDITGKSLETAWLYQPSGLKAKRLLLVGGGKAKKFTAPDLRKAAGGGVRWVSPFGPIRVDYGFNLDRRPGEKAANFHFSVGSPF